jgi:hypothetical protein
MSSHIAKGPAPELKEKINSYAGTRAVHWEMGFLAPVIIDKIVWSEQISAKSSQLIFATRLEPIDRIVMTYLDFVPPRTFFDVSAGWEYLTVRPDHWALSGFGASWRVSLNENACDELIKFYNDNSGLKKEDLYKWANRMLSRFGIF